MVLFDSEINNEDTLENISNTLDMDNSASFSDAKQENVENILKNNIQHPIWISVSESAKLGGIQTKTIRRAIKSNIIRYKIINNRYLIDFKTLIIFLHNSTKLKNKLNQFGIGQFIKEWK